MHSFPLCPFPFFAKDLQLAVALPVVHVTAMNMKLHNFTSKIWISTTAKQVLRDSFQIGNIQYLVPAKLIGDAQFFSILI